MASSANAFSGRSPFAAYSRRSWLRTCALALGGCLSPGMSPLYGASPEEGESSSQSRDEAIATLPLNSLTAETRRKLMAVVERPTIYRRLPHNTVDCDPNLFLFLVRNPEVVVNIWQIMGVSNMTAERTAPFNWKGNDGTGTICDVELIYGTDDLHILYSDGFYEGSLLRRRITGRCVLILQTGFAQNETRRWLAGNRLDVFLQIDNAGADAVARTLSPWVGKVADSNFYESCKFASKLSLTAEQNGPGMQRLSDKLTKVEPEVREEFTRVAVGVQQRAALRDLGQQARR